MTVSSPADDVVPVDGSLHETFDVEPPYEPAADALEHLAKYDDRFLDRELSWLRFNLRLLGMAEDESLPLLERVRSMAFFASNLDEFFMVRVAGLKRRIAAGMAVRAASGLMPRDILEAIWTRTTEQMQRHATFFRDDLVPALSASGIDLVRWEELDREEQKFAKRFFKEHVFPVLTPLAIDPAQPFPYISGLPSTWPSWSTTRGPARRLGPGEGAPDVQPGRGAGQPALRTARGHHRRAPPFPLVPSSSHLKTDLSP